MSGALVELVSKGAQDAYLISDTGMSFFKMKYHRHANFAQAPKRLEFSGQQPAAGGTSTITLTNYGDLVNYMWLEWPGGTSTNLGLSNALVGTVFELYIGGQKIDSQPVEYITDVWQTYIADTYSKSGVINNLAQPSYPQFMPLHFFFCDYNSFIPLVALQYHQVEIRCIWGPNTLLNGSNINVYANYIFLDAKERAELVSRPLEIIITQVQTLPVTFSNAAPVSVDLSTLNHPVKSFFFGSPTLYQFTDIFKPPNPNEQILSFSSASFQLNGTKFFEQMTPMYFYLVQSYFHTDNSVINWDKQNIQPQNTKFYMFNFCLSATSYKPTGTCNFSRIDNSKLTIDNVTCYPATQVGSLFAVNYNILKIQNGLGGILFGN